MTAFFFDDGDDEDVKPPASDSPSVPQAGNYDHGDDIDERIGKDGNSDELAL